MFSSVVTMRAILIIIIRSADDGLFHTLNQNRTVAAVNDCPLQSRLPPSAYIGRRGNRSTSTSRCFCCLYCYRGWLLRRVLDIPGFPEPTPAAVAVATGAFTRSITTFDTTLFQMIRP